MAPGASTKGLEWVFFFGLFGLLDFLEGRYEEYGAFSQPGSAVFGI